MQHDNRNLGVTEARFGLTLLICGLVAIGYIVLLRLGTTNDVAVENRPDNGPPAIAHVQAPPPDDEPRVLPIQTEITAQRPGTLPSGDSTGPPALQRR
jgi:hypothetical protein